MNEIERAIESCRARHGKFLGEYQGDISDAHRRKLEKQMQVEQVKISALEQQLTNGWIPVSEPPAEYGIYIVAWMPTGHTVDDIMKATKSKATHYYEMLEYDPEEDDGWEEIKQYDSYKILAWRNLPEPYKEDTDER